MLGAGIGCELVLGIEDTKAHPSSLESAFSPDVALGETHGCAVLNAHIYCWGGNEFGQLGVSGTEPSGRPLAQVLRLRPRLARC